MKNNHTQIIKFIFFLLAGILLSLIIGSLSNDDSPILSILLCFIPICLISLIFIKEKIWYVWFLCPAILLPFGTLSIYKYLIIYSLTLPVYCWYIFRKKIKPTWNSIPIIDIPTIIFILYVIYTFLVNPFGLGLDFFEDYYGGRGYLTILGGSIAFFLLSSLNTNSKQLGKLLNWSIPILIFFTVITTIKDYLIKTEDAIVTAEQITSGEGERESALLGISILTLQLLIIKYNIKDFLLKVWPSILALGGLIGVLISGFRSVIMTIAILYGLVCVLYRRWSSIVLPPICAIMVLSILSSIGYLRDLPYGVQRCLAPLEFLDIDPTIRDIAQASVDWRKEMWVWALDDRENFIKDKVWGDGFSHDIYIQKSEIYIKGRKMREIGDSMNNLEYAWEGQWHSTVISFINSLGYIGLIIFCIISIISLYFCWTVSNIYKHSPFKIPVIYLSLTWVIKVLILPISTNDITVLIPELFVTLSITKILYCCAKKEGLYITKSTRKEYIPLSCRTAQAK